MKTKKRLLKIFENFILSLICGVCIMITSSCNIGKNYLNDEPICGLATPIVFHSDTINLNLYDYFTDPGLIKSIQYPVGISSLKGPDSMSYRLIKSKELPFLSIIRFPIGRKTYSVLVKNIPKEKVVIQFDPKGKRVKTVKIRGSLNAWNILSSKMKKEGKTWKEYFELSPGEYQYLLVVDGKEMIDPLNKEIISNNIGGFNSVLKVGKYKQEDLPFIRTISFNNAEIKLSGVSGLDSIYAFWQNEQAGIKIMEDEVLVKVPLRARKIKRSYIRAVGYNSEGISNDILIPLEYGKVVTDASLLTRFDRQTMIIYFMMVDRFNNGKKTNDKPINDPMVLPKVNFFGGDLVGVTQKITDGYFAGLGVNTLWLSPITQNPMTSYGQIKKPHTRFSGYHGYWPISSIRIDFRFGNDVEFNELIDTAHKAGMNVLLDYVAHHIHELNPVYRQHPDWVTNLHLPDGSLNTERWDEYRLTTWFDNFLPTLDTRRPEIIGPMTDTALYWVERYGIDGFRHDATKHVDELFWRTLTQKLKNTTSCSPMVYQIGETYGSRELIGSYISTGMLDAQFDFNVYDDAVATFAIENESFERLKNSLNESLRYYGYHNLMGYITGNQDRPRFISYAGGDLKFGEDTKLAGWTRNIGVGNPVSYEKLKLLHAFNLTIPGIPVIYYGDEIGMPGANDPDNRRMMKFSGLTDKENEIKDLVTKLNKLRSSSMELIYGDIQFLEVTDNTMAFIRTYFNQSVLVFFNKGNKSEKIEVQYPGISAQSASTVFGQSFSIQSGQLAIKMKPYSFEIVTLK